MKPEYGVPIRDASAVPGATSRHEEILAAATCLFARHGYNDADTQALADELGVGKGTIYRCFPSKRELFLAAVDRVITLMEARIEESAVGANDPFDRITRAVRSYLDFFGTHPEYVELLIQERALFRDRKKPTYFEHRDRNADRWRRHYSELIAQGRIRELPVDQIRDFMNYLLYGTMFVNFFQGREKSAECQAAEIVEIVFRGIMSESEREQNTTEPPSPRPNTKPKRPRRSVDTGAASS